MVLTKRNNIKPYSWSSTDNHANVRHEEICRCQSESKNALHPNQLPSILSAKLFLCKMLVVSVKVKNFNSKIGITKGSETHLPVFLFPDKVDMDWGVAICWLKFPGTLSLVDALHNQNCTHTHTHTHTHEAIVRKPCKSISQSMLKSKGKPDTTREEGKTAIEREIQQETYI
jgi:hypothetical protein